jgi:prepilin-type N-terminal cleavage/methylation domain-containing protein
MKNTNRGFTLIELLVVIAIIGILASVVLVSLNSARSKGKDARVISDVNQLRTQLETDYTGSSYSNNLTTTGWSTGAATSSNYNTLIADAGTQGGPINVVTANNPVTAYALYGKLPSQTTATYFCIDSTGKTNPAASANTTSTCP